MVVSIYGFSKNLLTEGSTFVMGVIEMTFKRVPWNLITFENNECRGEVSALHNGVH